ncbi:MAG: ATP-binding cassette domain-containing protein [Candidatus Jorgensenbacteria bacterium]
MEEVRVREPEKVDLVCGMHLDGAADVRTSSYGGRTFYFCGDGCQGRFDRNPQKFQGTPLIDLRDVWKVFTMGVAETVVLRGLDTHIWEGDFVSIIGASGSGKSTMLNMMGLLDRPTKGEVYVRGKNVGALSDEEAAKLRSETFGFVFQQYNLIPWLTAFENAAIPLVFAGRDHKEETLLGRFREMGLTERMTHRPMELSGGEQQRVALIRALANDPAIILGDEPTGNLDSHTGQKILEILMELNRKHKKTLVIVTHDKDIAEMADEIITLKDGQMVADHRAHRAQYTE